MTDLEAIAACCINAAAMLNMADDGQKRDKDALNRLQRSNKGQAELLRKAADMALKLAASE